MGTIDLAYLDLPGEVLKTSMKEHQKFFSVRNPKTDRIERFITVTNMETKDRGSTILEGNQGVLSARLADAAFFWNNDLRTAKAGMGDWLDKLGNVTFERRLGSQADRVKRIAALARELAPAVGAEPELAEKAAQVAKADLSSEMVYEFPELQGVMGRYYALEAGLPEDVAFAAQEHYAPLGPSDTVPTRPVSVAVALADKLDLLTGFWAIDEKPTGSKDPFALRRAALGVIRLLLDNEIDLHLDQPNHAQLTRHEVNLDDSVSNDEGGDLLAALSDNRDFRAAFRNVLDNRKMVMDTPGFIELGSRIPAKAADLLAFIHDRLKVYMRDQGIRHDVIDACLSMPGNDNVALLVKRAIALSDVLNTDDGQNLLQGFKRANNILFQAEQADGVEYSYGPDIKFAVEAEETALFAALDTASGIIERAIKQDDFPTAMEALAALRAPVDAFFDAVQINTDNQIVRRNRLNLLARIRDIMLNVADLRVIEG